jgi:hypothetical protein
MSESEEPMDGEPRIDWTAAERAALDRLGEVAIPGDLEQSVVDALASRGLIGGPRERQTPRVPRRRAWAWGALALAACLAAFLAGIAVSDRGAGRGPAAAAAPDRFLLLLYEDESYRAPVTPAEQEARVAEYSAWAAGLRDRGVDVQGEELASAAEADRLDGRAASVDAARGEPAGSSGSLAGYFIVEAEDQPAAVEIARTTPHLRYGGTVIVRRVVRH